MKILLTGHEGFLGKHLHEGLKHHEVHGLDAKTYPEFQEKLNAIENTGTWYDFVIHCGAISDSREQSNLLWQLNYQATRDIGKLCETRNMKLIFISSCAAVQPTVPYGWSKHCAEFYLHHGVAGMHLSILRPFAIWGFDEEAKGNPSIMYKIMTGTLPEVYKGCVRDFVFVEDVVSAIVQVTQQWIPGIYELGTAVPTNIEAFVDDLYAETGREKPPVVPCSIDLKRVALQDYLLPNWNPTSIDTFLPKIKEFFNGHPGNDSR